MAGPLIGMMRSMGGAMFGTQIGQAVGVLAGEVVGSTDIGLPLGPAGKAALLPLNIDGVRQGPGRAARRRCGCISPCARPPTSGSSRTCRGCARTCSARSRGTRAGSRSTPAKLEDVVGQFDPQNPEQLQEALQQGMFQPEDTPEQKAALARLETALALVEGWVDAVVHAAAEAASAVGGRAARDAAPAPRLGRPGRADLRHADRPGAASAPAAGRLPAVGLAHGRARAWTAATACGRTRTCCRPPRTWTTRTASSTASSWTSPSWTRCSARRAGGGAAGKPDDGKKTDDERRTGTSKDDGDRVSLHDDAVLVLKDATRTRSELRQAYLDHLAAHPDGMWKACGAGHITASALVIDPRARPGAADPAPEAAACGCRWAATASRRTPRWRTRRCARPRRSPASPG